MHAPAQLQADFPADGHGVGAHAHFLMRGDARVGTAQVRGTYTTACQQRFAGQAFGLEGAEHQRHRVQGGEMGMQHARFQREGAVSEQVVCRGGEWLLRRENDAGRLKQLCAHIQLNQAAYFGQWQIGAQQRVQLAEHRFAGHAAP